MASASCERTGRAGGVMGTWSAWRWGLALLCWGACACEAENHEIQVESVELASGEYYGLSWGGTQVERFHVLAHRGTKTGDVVIVSAQHAEPCSLGPVSAYATVQPANGGKYVVGSPSPARIALYDQRNADGIGRLGFTDVDCKRTPLEVQGVSPSAVRTLPSKDLSEITLAVLEPDDTLDFVKPWSDEQEIVAHDVTSLRPHESGVWLIEHGQAVKRDHEGRERARLGQDVREVYPLSEELDVAIVDRQGLSMQLNGKLISVDRDACHVRSMSAFLPHAIGYFSPCDSRQLVVRRPKDATGEKAELFHYDQTFDALFASGGRLLFTVSTDTETELWAVSSSKPKDPVHVLTRERFQIESLSSLPGGRYLIAARESDDTLDLLVLAGIRADSELSTLERDIDDLSSYETALAITRSDQTLTLRDRDDLHVIWRSDGIRADRARFLFDGRATALAYLQHIDDATGLGELKVHFVSGEDFSIAKHVREFHEVWWPERGLVYATGGSDAAMRFARIDVPCEKVSDSPWACGF